MLWVFIPKNHKYRAYHRYCSIGNWVLAMFISIYHSQVLKHPNQIFFLYLLMEKAKFSTIIHEFSIHFFSVHWTCLIGQPFIMWLSGAVSSTTFVSSWLCMQVPLTTRMRVWPTRFSPPLSSGLRCFWPVPYCCCL